MRVHAEKELSDLLLDIVSGKVTSAKPDTVDDIARLYLRKPKDLSDTSLHNLSQLTREFRQGTYSRPDPKTAYRMVWRDGYRGI